MAKRVPAKKRSAAALFETLQQENVNIDRTAKKTFSDVATQTAREELIPPKADPTDSKLNKCLTLLAHANAKLDALGAAGPSQCKHEHQAVVLNKIILKPVKDLHDMEVLEENCKNEEFVKSIVASIGQLHGRQRYTGRGVTVCLQIMDYFFDRQFLLHCSWTGTGRKSADQEQVQRKVPFCKFEGVIDLFYQTILRSDPDFSMVDCKEFLHRCLRNSKQRFAEIGGTRKPTARKRKHLQESNYQDNEFKEDEEQDVSATEPAGPIWTVEYSVVE